MSQSSLNPQDPNGSSGQRRGPVAAGPGVDYPGKTLGIVGLVLSFFTTIIGFIISIVALSQSRKAGYKNTPALAGVIIGAVATVIVVIAIIASVVVGASSARP